MAEEVKIPVDIYESADEIVIVMPLAGVPKESIKIWLEKTTLYVAGDRRQPKLKETLKPVVAECFW
jgi:HSP20 family molecular chaperone IbpA